MARVDENFVKRVGQGFWVLLVTDDAGNIVETRLQVDVARRCRIRIRTCGNVVDKVADVFNLVAREAEGMSGVVARERHICRAVHA